MADYAIGDVQGCYDQLMQLLDHIQFNDRTDRLWFVGDLVNRGPLSLKVLRFVKNLSTPAYITLGNHDLHLLAKIFVNNTGYKSDDTLAEILKAPDVIELGHWLRKQSIIKYCPTLSVVVCHAGIAPCWNLSEALQAGQELESVLSGEHYTPFLTYMYGNHPDHWSSKLQGIDRLRVITNYFTRMRFCTLTGRLDFKFDGTLEQAPPELIPWFSLPDRKVLDVDIVFGHWAALMGVCSIPRIHAIDTGCVWGGQLTALRLQDKYRFMVPGLEP